MTTNTAKQIPTGSTNGIPVKLTGTSSGGAVTWHTCTNTASTFDQVWLSCYNTDTVDRALSLSLGDTTDPITINIPSKASSVLCVGGGLFNGGVVISAWGAAANVLFLYGDINRITN